MKQGLIIFILLVAATFQIQANCFSIGGNGTNEVTISIEPSSDYTNPPHNFWTTGLVTISWPESEGTGFVTALSNQNGFAWSADGIATLDAGTYYQKYQFSTQNNIALSNGVPLELFRLTVNTPTGNVGVSISENPPAAVTNGTPAFANVLGDQFSSGGCNLSTTLSPLPIVLASFEVLKKGEDNAHVTWETASEQNTSHFEVERSLDGGTNWEKVGVVAAEGNSSEALNYSLEDNNLKRFIAANQLVYYRLKSVDYDQSFDYSGVKNIAIKFDHVAIQVFPNPTTEGVNVSINMPERNDELTAIVKDIHGKTMTVVNLGNDRMINEYLPLTDLTSGTYFISVEGNNKVYSTERIVLMSK